MLERHMAAEDKLHFNTYCHIKGSPTGWEIYKLCHELPQGLSELKI